MVCFLPLPPNKKEGQKTPPSENKSYAATPWKINVEAENDGLVQMIFPLQMGYSQVPADNFSSGSTLTLSHPTWRIIPVISPLPGIIIPFQMAELFYGWKKNGGELFTPSLTTYLLVRYLGSLIDDPPSALSIPGLWPMEKPTPWEFLRSSFSWTPSARPRPPRREGFFFARGLGDVSGPRGIFFQKGLFCFFLGGRRKYKPNGTQIIIPKKSIK